MSFDLYWPGGPARNLAVTETLTIGFLGAGKMATALAKGFIGAGLVSPSRVIASDPSQAARSAFAQNTEARTTDSNAEVARFGGVVILAVKPDQIGRAHV